MCNLQTRKSFAFFGLQNMVPGTTDSETSPYIFPLQISIFSKNLIPKFAFVSKLWPGH